MAREKVVLGLSGGVDSAVAALLLLQRDYSVTGLYLDNHLSDTQNLPKIAHELGVELRVKDISQALERHVCQPFQQAYLCGKTPLPCAVCNFSVKFPALLEEADRIGARYVATGHYAQTENGYLFRGNPANDQAYMLSRLTNSQLQRVLFPLGSMAKTQVRELAKTHNLSVFDTPDSMEICFIPDNNYAKWLDCRTNTPPPGDFVDLEGHVLGQHRGIHRYTIGQGSGLGISSDRKLYVSAILPDKNQVVLSDGSDLFRRQILCHDPNWLTWPLPDSLTARFRHSRTETPVSLTFSGETVLVEAKEPVRAPTPGQLAVFYSGPQVVGSAWILSAPSPDA